MEGINYYPQKQHSSLCRIATIEYMGDGTRGRAIVGVGFRPKDVRIARYPDTDNDLIIMCWKNDLMPDEYCIGLGGAGGFVFERRFAILTLDDDGFTIDDYNNDEDPNTDGQPYVATCLG